MKNENSKTTVLRQQDTLLDAKCWFMNERFTKNCIYSMINSSLDKNGVFKYDYVLGLDIGGAGNTAHIMKKYYKIDSDGSKTLCFDTRAAILDEKGRENIPSMISFTEMHEPIIGYEAKDKKIFNSCFKTAPSRWAREEEEANNKEPKPLTSKYLTKHFIMTLFLQIMKYNSFPDEDFDIRKAYMEKKLLICVGCPVSHEWTKKDYSDEYRRLISEACSVDESFVHIIPESTAAIMSVVGENVTYIDKKRKIDITKGLCIFDMGAVTVDITYIVPGKRIITHSIELGGQDIDKQMLMQILEDNKMSVTNIPPEQISYILACLREWKEVFYEDGKVTDGKIILWGKDENGKISADVDSEKNLSFVIDERFMNKVLDKPLPKNGQSIAEILQSELNSTILMPRSHGRYNCDKLIISGGTSKVTRFREIIGEYFGEITDIDMDPTKRVSKGLCAMKAFEISGTDCFKAYRLAENRALESQFSVFAKDLSDYMTAIVSEHLSAVIALELTKDTKKVEISELCKSIISRCNSDERLTGDKMQDKIAELTKNYITSFAKDMTKEANKLSERIYSSSIISFSATNITQQHLDIDLLVSKVQDIVSTLWNKSTSTGIIVMVGFIVLMLLAAINPLIPVVAVAILVIKPDILDYLTDREIYISKKALKLYKYNNSKNSLLKKKISKNLVKEISELSDIKKFLADILGAHSEIIFGKVLLWVFDEKPAD